MATFMTDINKYVVYESTGRSIEISKELFMALEMFIGPGKPAGSLNANFKNGNAASVEVLLRSTLK